MSNKGDKVNKDDRRPSALGNKRPPSEERNEDSNKQKTRAKKAKAGIPGPAKEDFNIKDTVEQSVAAPRHERQ
jgi:hypothetical protein